MNHVYINATGVVSSKGVGSEAHAAMWNASLSQEIPESFALRDFKAAPYLSDKKVLKSVSESDALGLVAIEDLKKSAARYLREDPYRNGFYVGSPPGSAHDNSFYYDAIRDAGSLREFGAACMSSRPTTLLIGLPNNVLCYGSIILGVKGPNSNYTSTFLSGHIALQTAARKVRRGQLETAVAGGFAMHSEEVNSAMYEQHGIASRNVEKAKHEALIPIADGAVFVVLSNERNADGRNVEFIDSALASDGLGPKVIDQSGAAFESMINDLLGRNSVSKESVGLLLANSSGFGLLDECEKSVLSRVYANERVKPALGCSRKVLGNLMEAGGLFEFELARKLYDAKDLPECVRLPEYDSEMVTFNNKIDPSRPYALVLRASPWGEYSAVLVKMTEVQV